MLWGTVLEPVLASVYAERTSRKVRRVNAVLQHPEFPYLLANLDREVVGLPEGTGILEIKTASYHSAPQWEEGVPVSLSVSGVASVGGDRLAWADVAVLIGGQDFRIYRIERDENKIADLLSREAAFWRCVTEDVQPRPDGSTDAGAALQWLYPQDNGLSVDFTDSAEFCQLFADLLKLRDIKGADRSSGVPAQAAGTECLGDATTALFAGGKVTWKKSKDRVAPDIDRLSTEHPEIVQQYSKPIAGSRRFVIQTDRRSAS